MAVSDVQIAKLALQHLGDRFAIESLTEASTEAEQINLVYENVRDSLLREHPWKFALRYTSPAALSGTPPAQWGYMYTYPSGALRVWRIINPLDPRGNLLPPLKWTIGRNASNAKVILTDEEEPEFEYTAQVTDATEFDANFVMAFSWRLAEIVARPLTMDENITERVRRESIIQIGQAKQNDSNEGVTEEQNRDPDWLRSRL